MKNILSLLITVYLASSCGQGGAEFSARTASTPQEAEASKAQTEEIEVVEPRPDESSPEISPKKIDNSLLGDWKLCLKYPAHNQSLKYTYSISQENMMFELETFSGLNCSDSDPNRELIIHDFDISFDQIDQKDLVSKWKLSGSVLESTIHNLEEAISRYSDSSIQIGDVLDYPVDGDRNLFYLLNT